jgi:hypothetical protein
MPFSAPQEMRANVQITAFGKATGLEFHNGDKPSLIVQPRSGAPFAYHTEGSKMAFGNLGEQLCVRMLHLGYLSQNNRVDCCLIDCANACDGALYLAVIERQQRLEVRDALLGRQLVEQSLIIYSWCTHIVI